MVELTDDICENTAVVRSFTKYDISFVLNKTWAKTEHVKYDDM